MKHVQFARFMSGGRRRELETSGTEPPRSRLLQHPVWARPRILWVIGLGGALGACARYELSLAVTSRPGTFPLSTFIINVGGSFVLGVLLVLILERLKPTEYIRPFAATGFLGAYTTWSTFMVETDDLIKSGRVILAAGYVTASLVAGLGAMYLGIMVVRTWPPVLGRPDRQGTR